MTSIDLTLCGAEVLTEEGLHVTDLGISDGRLGASDGRRIDLSGYMILPGMVDIHGDGFERQLAPRRGAMKDLAQGLAATDAELGACGITTAVLAQFFSWEGGMRGPDFAERLVDAAAGVHPAQRRCRCSCASRPTCWTSSRRAEALIARHARFPMWCSTITCHTRRWPGANARRA